jgi:DNA-binding Xre family transcriptional regulator
MATIIETLTEALAASGVPLREIERETGVDAATLSRLVTGVRGSVSLSTMQTLCDYLGLELRPVPKSRRR